MASIAKLLLAAAFVVSLVPGASAQSMYYSIAGRDRTDPAVNIQLSAQYDHLLQTNMRFRHYRMWKECHIINWPALHADCIASFDLYEPVLVG